MTKRRLDWRKGPSGLWLSSSPRWGLAAGLVVGACGGSVEGGYDMNAEPPSTEQAQASPTADQTLDVSGLVTISPSPTTVTSNEDCGTRSFFEGQGLTAPIFRRVLYSWTTDEQAAELRDNQVLFTRTERPGLGPGYAFEALTTYAGTLATSEQELAAQLGGLFSKARYAWHNPWATRMGWSNEDYGNNLIRIVLKPEAWLVSFDGEVLTVEDAQGNPIPTETALQSPERIGVIFFQRGASLDGPSCYGSFVSGGNGYREFIVGNEAMIESWSLGTEEIRARLESDIEELTAFLEDVRSCPRSTTDFNLQVVCWSWPSDVPDPYDSALAIPSSLYEPTPLNIATLIETLKSDLFEPDPLTVEP